MAVTNARRKRAHVWIPPVYNTEFTITVEYSDGTVEDLRDILSSFEVEDRVTEGVGNFTLKIHDPDESLAHKFTGNEIIRYYKDYAKTATTLVFRGRVEKPNKRGNKLELKGRSESLKILDINVTASYNNTECSVILKDLFSQFTTGFTTTNVETTETSLTVNWTEKPFLEAVQELTNASGSEFYIDASLDANFFESGSRDNTTDAIVHDYNLIEVKDFTPDLTLVRNRVSVYGAVVDGVQILATATQQTGEFGTDTIGVKELIINDTSVVDYTAALELATFELNSRKDPPEVGEVTGILLATVKPGENVRISSPADNLPPQLYITGGYKDMIDYEGGGGFTTILYINREPRQISHIIKNRIENENKKKEASLNQFALKQSYNFLYNEDTGTKDRTEITNGILQISAGNSSGRWFSDKRDTAETVTEASLVLVGQTLTGVRVFVSGNNGTSYEEVTTTEKLTLSASNQGKELKIRVNLDDTTTQVDSLSILYK